MPYAVLTGGVRCLNLSEGSTLQMPFLRGTKQTVAKNRKASALTKRGMVAVSAAQSNGAESNGSSANREYDYDLFCIGAGSGGVRAARVAAGTYGARVGICEMPFNTIASDEAGGAGGTCVLRGCVPKKLFVYCSQYREMFKEAEGFGWKIPENPSLDWSSFMEKKNNELRRLNGIYENLLENSGVEMIQGRGVIVDPHTVEVAGKRITAKNIVIATGAKAFVPEFEGSELSIISDHALELKEVPKSIGIVGGGYIAVEFAGIFAGLGSEVHLFVRQPLTLRGFDHEVREFVTEQYSKNGIHVHTCRTPKSLVQASNGKMRFTVESTLSHEDAAVYELDHVLMATGRRPNVANLGLENVGVKLSGNGAIEVDEYSRTNVPSIWAVGDVTDRMALTPVALMEAMALTKTIFAGEPTKPDYDNIPTAVFSNPEIATVGMTEKEAVGHFGKVDVYTSNFKPMRNTISGSEGRMFMKVVVDANTDKVVGCHIVGDDAAEMMQIMGLAVKMGATKKQLDSVVGIHPSSAEELVTMRTPTRSYTEGKAEALV